jgi:hypothetical protein
LAVEEAMTVTQMFHRRSPVRIRFPALILAALVVGSQTQAGTPPGPKKNAQGDLLGLARQRIKEEVKPGVVILVPRDEGDRNRLAFRLGQLLGAGGTDTGFHSLATPAPAQAAQSIEYVFCQAIFICMPVAQARAAFPQVDPRAAVVLLGLDGKPTGWLAESPGLFEENFVPAMTELLHGGQGERLAATVRAQKQALGKTADTIEAAVRDLDHDRFRKREAASRLLARMAERTTAILVSAHQKAPSLEARRRIERLLDAVLAAEAGPLATPLPIGLTWAEPQADPVRQAGAVIPPGQPPSEPRRLLRFVWPN